MPDTLDPTLIYTAMPLDHLVIKPCLTVSVNLVLIGNSIYSSPTTVSLVEVGAVGVTDGDRTV